MDISQKILSDIIVFNKYAKHNKHLNRRETWNEICYRNMGMHVAKFPSLREEIVEIYKNFVIPRKVLPSMRSMQFAGAPIDISNTRIFNCFGVDTKFITSHGVKSFADFSHGDNIDVLTHTGEWKPAVVKSYGKQSLNKITLKRGKSTKVVAATPNHRWLLFDGTETTRLAEKDVLLKTPMIFDFDFDSATPTQKLYWCYGYVFGDGSLVKDKTGNHRWSMVRLCGEKENLFLDRFVEMGFKTSKPLSCGGDAFVYTGSYLKTPPNPEIDDVEYISAFVAGYCDADAAKNRNYERQNTFSKYTRIQTSDATHQEFIETCFEMVGLYITNKEDLTGQQTNYGIRPTTYRYGLTNDIGRHRNSAWVVSTIENDSEVDAPVWCLEVEDNHSFVLAGGIVTGNCAYLPIEHPFAFAELMFLLLGGTGTGFSVQKHHIEKLPVVVGPIDRPRRYLVGDSIEGWADAVKVLVKAYTKGKSNPVFDYRDIRPKGARLVTSGGKAPGPDPLRICIERLRAILNGAIGRKLKSIEVYDMCCYIADAVLAGGIRRAAMICGFDRDDMDMLYCKSGVWDELNPQRGRCNNSVILPRDEVTEEEFLQLWQVVQNSGAGEPGFYWTNDKDVFTNPCCEISLNPYQFCNLTEVNVSDVHEQYDLNNRCEAAAAIGTLQAAYTDFHYLRNIWKDTTEKEALIGVGMTGIASGTVLNLDLKEAADVVRVTNGKYAYLLGINPAARTTTVKPSGTSSLVVGSSSGIHAWHNDYYIRRVRVGKNEALYQYVVNKFPDLVEDCIFKPHLESVVSFPQKAPEGAILRNEKVMDLLDRVKKFNTEWVRPGYREGANHHNVSCTISIKNHEWDRVAKWMWNNRECYNGISVLPYDGHTYKQAPFEDCTEEEYNRLMGFMTEINLTEVIETDDNTDLQGEQACAGGQCAV